MFYSRKHAVPSPASAAAPQWETWCTDFSCPCFQPFIPRALTGAVQEQRDPGAPERSRAPLRSGQEPWRSLLALTPSCHQSGCQKQAPGRLTFSPLSHAQGHLWLLPQAPALVLHTGPGSGVLHTTGHTFSSTLSSLPAPDAAPQAEELTARTDKSQHSGG